MIGKTLEAIMTEWNTGAERMYGYSAKEAIGKSVGMLVPVDRPNEIRDVRERLKRSEIVGPFETLRVRRDGKVAHIEITASPVKDAMDRIVGASTIARDISVRKAAEEKLIQMESKYRSLLVIVNQTGKIVLLNLQSEK
jgi:PAS domain S-box-containing protein